jgi:hypothetical protein
LQLAIVILLRRKCSRKSGRILKLALMFLRFRSEEEARHERPTGRGRRDRRIILKVAHEFVAAITFGFAGFKLLGFNKFLLTAAAEDS